MGLHFENQMKGIYRAWVLLEEAVDSWFFFIVDFVEVQGWFFGLCAMRGLIWQLEMIGCFC